MSKRGFGAMDPEQRRQMARKGGRMSGGNFKNDRNRAAELGSRGGKNSSGTFAADPARAAAAGRKGGKGRKTATALVEPQR